MTKTRTPAKWFTMTDLEIEHVILDADVDKVTAFRTWAEMVIAMKGGYVPTLRHSPEGHNIARAAEAAGLRVWFLR